LPSPSEQVSIGFEYQVFAEIPLEVWERNRSPRRHDDALLMGWKHRRHIVKKVASRDEITQALDEVARIRRKREQTFSRQRYELVGAVATMACQKLKKLNLLKRT
jgi:hypothetical protein